MTTEIVPLSSSLTNLSNEEHTIVYATTVNASLSPAFDFLAVVAGMKGRNVVVDDGYSAMIYTGNKCYGSESRLTLSINEVVDNYSIGFDFVTYDAIFDSIDAIPTVRKPDKHVGAIVGGVIGGLAFISLVIFTFVWWRRRGQPKGSRFALRRRSLLLKSEAAITLQTRIWRKEHAIEIVISDVSFQFGCRRYSCELERA
ncbi:hypothetical protein CPB85DRAFT_1257172 [Mucidula mucida]|nr:hypothetical protein CPB85DRAFT_1257172 [Mucidula mucida]